MRKVPVFAEPSYISREWRCQCDPDHWLIDPEFTLR